MKYYSISKQNVDLYVDVVDGDFEYFKLNGGFISEIDQGQVSGMIKHGGWCVDATNPEFRVIVDDPHFNTPDQHRFYWENTPIPKTLWAKDLDKWYGLKESL